MTDNYIGILLEQRAKDPQLGLVDYHCQQHGSTNDGEWEVVASCVHGQRKLTGSGRASRKQDARRYAAKQVWDEYCKLIRNIKSATETKETKNSDAAAGGPSPAQQKLKQLLEQHPSQLQMKQHLVIVQCTCLYRGEELTTVGKGNNEAQASELAYDEMLRVVAKLIVTSSFSSTTTSAR